MLAHTAMAILTAQDCKTYWRSGRRIINTGGNSIKPCTASKQVMTFAAPVILFSGSERSLESELAGAAVGCGRELSWQRLA